MSQVVYEKRDRFAYLRLNRPEAKNAIDKEMHLALCEIWADFRGRRRARPRHRDRDRDRCVFCAGMDLKTFVPEYPGAMPQMIRVRAELGLGGLPRGFHGIPKPMIAALNGWALAADFELTLAADIRIASERAGSGSVEARRGFHHGDGMILRLINACGTGVAA